MSDLTPRRPPVPASVRNELARATGDVAYAGSPVSYVGTLARGDAWARLSPAMRLWAEEEAGDPIRDPHTGTPTVYWNCLVEPEAGGPRGAAVGASYRLVMFGRRGLVVSTGTTDRYVDVPDSTGWRHARNSLRIDEQRVRSDHRRGASPVRSATAGTSAAPGRTLLDEHVGRTFGNLPGETQRFLLAPFLPAPTPPRADVHARTDVRGPEFCETYWTYVFSARWVAFAHSVRAVPYRSGLSGPDLWHDSPEAAALPGAPWAVAAWVAPVLPSSSDLRPARR